MTADIVLLNGSTEPRTRASEGVTFVEDAQDGRCGCAHNATHWLQMCRLHWSEDNALHRAALAEHAREAAIDPLLR